MDLNEKFRQMWERSRNVNGKVKRRGPMGCEDYFKGCEDYEKEDGGEDDEEEKPSSRIFRVSKASGGKDRHCKVYTAKGLRDRRVRLSVSTAIQFYDLQDRLGYDQPSKAVEWLIKAATEAIAELPPLNGTFPNSSSPLHDSFYESGRDEGSEEWVLVGKGGDEHDPDPDLNIHRHLSEITRSTCSSTSETSKGSVLSLSRSEIRIKARERARERTKEKVEISTVTPVSIAQHGLNPNSHGDGSKKTEMTGGSVPFASSAMDYLNSGVFNPDLIPKNQNHNQSLPLMSLAPFNPPFMDHHHELQQFSFFQDRIIPVASSNDYNLDFSMPSFSAGHDRGTLQSNSSLLSRNQKFSSPISTDDGSSMPFFIPIAGAGENQHPGGFDGRLQLSYGRHLELKGKGKS